MRQVHLLMLLLSVCGQVYAQIPILNSKPSITGKVIYLDFDGQVVSGTGWNNGNTINAAPSGLSNNNKIIVWKRVSEDYMPFDVNVTTDENRFNNAPPNKRIRVIITPTSSWYGSAGGVAFVGSFQWGGTPGTPCWVFENQLGGAKSVAEAASHEAGHTFSLRHQSTYNSACTKTAEYNPGQGSGVTGMAPIMGVGYNKNVTVWYNGKSATSCNLIQNDHSSSSVGLTGPGYLSFEPDDVGDNLASAKFLNLNSLTTIDSGLVTTPGDIDAYQFTICQNRYVGIQVKPWALDTNNYSGANLDVKLCLYEATTNSMVTADSSLSRLHARVGANLSPGTYYFTVDGHRSNNYSDYGSLGRYYVNVKATNPPVLSSTIQISSSCMGQNVVLYANSNGAPTTWQWTVTGNAGSNIHHLASPSPTFSAPGPYTLQLITSNNTATSCVITNTVFISSIPALAINPPTAKLCAPGNVTLSASGASSYTWLPGGFSGSSQILSPSASTTYTLIGANGGCQSIMTRFVDVVPAFNVALASSGASLCAGETVTLTASGATAYTINPGAMKGNIHTLSPLQTTTFTALGETNGCVRTATRIVSVIPQYTLIAATTDTFVCAGAPVMLMFDGGSNYTIQPGNLNGNPAFVQPTITTNYTITSSHQGHCPAETQLKVEVDQCDTDVAEILNVPSGVFPNPVTDVLTIQCAAQSTVRIFDVSGSLVANAISTTTHLTIAMQEMQRGLYFVEISGNRKTEVHKIVKD